MPENREGILEAQINRYRKERRSLWKIVTSLSLVVVFVVFWNLKLTGIGIAGEAFCGNQEHTHSDECIQTTLVCTQEEAPPHTHGESCLDTEPVCGLEERDAHSHGEACWTVSFGCGREETAGHTHTEECLHPQPICGQEEREAHSHGEGCWTVSYGCGQEETDGHIHTEDCGQTELVCTLEEQEGHTHEEGCWPVEWDFGCGQQETAGHTHTEDCRQRELTCALEEQEGHTHGEGCWAADTGFGCGQQEADGHVHSGECLTEQTRLGCGLEAGEGHTHQDPCYGPGVVCQQEEHIHIESCYSDITADLQTSDDWEKELADMARGPTLRENLVLVARSQLGSGESSLNFQVDAFGIRRGITRYGQWYGNPYGDWSAMFAAFCLHYAGAPEELPFNAGPEALRLDWEKAGLYQSAEGYTPCPGDLVFLHLQTPDPQIAVLEEARSGSVPANAVAIVTEVSEGTVTVIQGDADNAVAELTYELTDRAILGWGLTPEPDAVVVLAAPPAGTVPIANAVNYSSGLLSGGYQFVFYAQSGSNTYAIDGNGNAVQVYIGDDGKVYTDLADPGSLLWTISSYNNNSWAIQNMGTGRYLHPFYNSGTDNGIITPGRWGTTIGASGTGVKFSHSAYVGMDLANGRFRMVRQQNQNVTFRVGITQRCTVWLDGTDGGLGHLTGSPDVGYSVAEGDTMLLPTEWTSPSKYSYKLRGWYDVTNGCYYPPGAEIQVTGNMVLYADWVASTYDIGVFNAQVADTVSTDSFITTHMFDYNYLFNVQSARPQITVSASDHSETWSMVTSGTVPYGGQETFNFIFVDNDSGGLLCIPNNRNNQNLYPGAGVVTPGIYSSKLRQLLFATDNVYDPATGTGVIGKTYLGTGDHLYQIMDDPADEHYGYYYYDSKRNAASFNQSRGRFYVYDYLEATSDAIGSTNSDFLPLNSPYTNTNGKTVGRYDYDGVDGEYAGVSHYRYDSKYNSGNHNSTGNVQTDYAYGMRSDVKFYLPNDPGSGGNKDLYGNDMQFQFSGDDDLWVLIDGKLVLDIGGIHGAESGVIDFSTGQVTVQGEQQTTLMDLGIGAGDHTMSILYLERGSSLSNCSIYFNLAPRFGLQIQKEDVLTQQLLDGTQFTVYEDLACTQSVNLWESEAAYNRDLEDGVLDDAKSTFTIKNGVAKLWGLGSGNTYYIKETASPDAQGYGLAQGVIRLTIEKGGLATYHVDVIPDAEGNGPSNGFTVHGVEIDEKTKTVYMIATNAPETVTETTTVQVIKQWQDSADHSGDYIQAYLTVTDPDGTVRRIREITLSDENDWTYLWTNLPKYDYDTLSEVCYGIEESYESGYYSTVRKVTQIVISKTEWAEALTFQNGETYILGSASGYLATLDNRADTGFKWVNEETAKASPNALWTAAVNGSKVKFTNAVGQTITFYYGNGSPTDFYARIAAPGSNDRQEFSYSSRSGGLQIFYQNGRNYYYLTGTMNSSGKFGYTTRANSSLILNPKRRVTQEDIREVEDWAYEITNTPLDANNETSLAVRKEWQIPAGYDPEMYEEFAVTVRLLAGGVPTGRTVTLTLKNGWQGSFQGLPYTDPNGNVIHYTVSEVWEKENWTTTYGEITATGGAPPDYSTVITNSYYPGGPELPSTGSPARLLYVLCGTGIMLGTLVYAVGSRRKRERRRF